MSGIKLSEQEQEIATNYAAAAEVIGASYCTWVAPVSRDDGGEDAVAYAMRDGEVVVRESEPLCSGASPTLN